jgi:hypothetical protein
VTLFLWRGSLERHTAQIFGGSFTHMIKVLEALLGKISRERPATKSKSMAAKRPNGDFRAVEIAPSIMCCAAAVQVAGKSFLLREAPRLPLYGCTMPTNCSCGFRKYADRRDSDRRSFGTTETNRWFGGFDSRKRGRRSAEKVTVGRTISPI